jgi:hypothetical protein
MSQVKLVGQKRSGLFPEHKGVGPLVHEGRATIPVVEALRAAGANIEPLPAPKTGYKITLGLKMPKGIVAVHLNESPWIGLRLENEPEYPQESPDYWQQVDFTPCPVCGAPVVWYEAGYVPGYRVCAKPPHHHSIAK